MGQSDPPAAKNVDAQANPFAQTIASSSENQPVNTLVDRAPQPSSDPGQTRPSGVLPRLGRYALLRVLGEGGMGVVYAAYDEELDRRVALKLIHPTLQGDSQIRARVLREAQALARVSSPHVVTIYETGEVDGQVFIAMEYVNGTTLTKWQSESTRSWHDILAMSCRAPICDADRARRPQVDPRLDPSVLFSTHLARPGLDGTSTVATLGT